MKEANNMKKIKRFVLCGLLCVAIFLLAGCTDKDKMIKDSLSGINQIFELATLKCYYHDVAEYKNEKDGILFGVGNIGFQKAWIEYDATVKVGIDAGSISISGPDEKHEIYMTVPRAKVLSVDIENISKPLTEKGWLTKDLTANQQTQAIAEARNKMEETAQNDEKLMMQAQRRAQKIIEGYVQTLNNELKIAYTVNWVETE